MIYAAIVAGWAAVLVPRWVRRNEEIDQARAADAARGVRVLQPTASPARGARTQAPHETVAVGIDEPPVTADEPEDIDHYWHGGRRRRRRVLIVLVLALVTVTVMAVIGTLPLWSVAVPALTLGGFLKLARRAAVAEATRTRMRRRRADAANSTDTTASRRAVVDEAQPAEPVDPHAWEPVPVPLPTYLTKDKAPDIAPRTIDLTRPGAWTSALPDPTGSPISPRPIPVPQPALEDVDDLPEHRPAVGD